MRSLTIAFALLTLAGSGCASPEQARRVNRSTEPVPEPLPISLVSPAAASVAIAPSQDANAGNGVVAAVANVTKPDDAAETIPLGLPDDVVQLDDVIESVYRSYPLLEAALYARDLAVGEQLAARGAFDSKLKGATENGPLGFYENYRQNIGIEQPTYWGGSVFGGYRIGRGSFQPWYLERQTDDGGELRAGVAVPLARNVSIDARRAQLWRTNVDRQLVEPEIRLQRIDFVRAASYAYWDWIAAGRRYQIAVSLLKIAEDRNDAIRRKVEMGDTEPPVLQDNRRLIVSREAKLFEAQGKLQQAAIKLSLFYRDDRGEPLVADSGQLADFATPQIVDEDALAIDREVALANRPELLALTLRRQQLQIDFNEARNEFLPDIQGVVGASQDVGAPASSKNDKSEFELEAGLFLDMPLQRRKARGKMTAAEGKLRQLAAKQRMTADKITAEVQAIYAALLAAFQQSERARESAVLANRLAEIERRKFELGESDLLSVNLREQQAAEAESTNVDALYVYFAARADYRAILAGD